MSAIFVNQINRKYLMKKSKDDMASLCLWIIGNQKRDRKDIDELLRKVVECLDDGNIEGAQTLLRAWEKWHELWEDVPAQQSASANR